MLKIIRSIRELNFGKLADVYTQSCQELETGNFSDIPLGQRILLAEQDLYGEVKCFFADKNAFYAIWEVDGCYVSALRMEPYKDGLLLEGLETKPSQRNKGYAKKLILAVLAELKESKAVIYSHIDKKNAASIAVHCSCGFEKIQDIAVYADGSVSHSGCTMRKML